MEILWGLVVGIVFSTVGAAGAILAGVGHLSLFAIKEANLVKFYNQFLVVLSPMVSLPLYIRQKRVVFWLALFLALGSILGALAGSYLSYHYLKDLKNYKQLFGLLTLLIGAKVLYDAYKLSRVKEGNKSMYAGLKGFHIVIDQGGGIIRVNIISPLLVGFGIALLSSAMGVGGGFLIVPYMLLVMGLLAYYVPGTAIVVVYITTLTSLLNYYNLGVRPDWSFLLKEAIGVWIGSALGPYISKLIGERLLRTAIGFLLLGLGMAYSLRLL
ncbi:MAG: sulfite exporter TauE/SafE family protein [Aquificaceae bacterium]